MFYLCVCVNEPLHMGGEVKAGKEADQKAAVPFTLIFWTALSPLCVSTGLRSALQTQTGRDRSFEIKFTVQTLVTWPGSLRHSEWNESEGEERQRKVGEMEHF